MAVVETLLGEAKGVFGKAYLLAGLLPAGLLLVSASWYLWGLGGIRERLFAAPAGAVQKEQGKEVAASEASTTEVALGAGAAVAILGLVFFAARGPLLLFLQELPGDGFRPVRRRLRAKQVACLNSLLEDERRLRWLQSVFIWALEDFNPEYTYVEAWITPPSLPQAIRSTEAARHELKWWVREFTTTGRLPGERETKIIEDGLRSLRETIESKDDSCWGYEASVWRTTVESKDISRLLSYMADDRYREWAEVKRKIDNFPQERWVQPTALGNRFGAIEEYSLRRYKVDMNTFWARIVGVLSDSQRKEVEDAQLTVEVLLNLVAAAALFVVVVLWTVGQNAWRVAFAAYWNVDWRSAGALAGGIILSLVSYRGAVFAVGSLRDKVVRLFDLNQAKLVGAMGFEAPKTFGKQLQLLKELNEFFTRGQKIGDDWVMKQSMDEEKKPAETQKVAGG